MKALREVGIQPDFLICRSEKVIADELRKKIALFCSVQAKNVIAAPDVKIIYELPLFLQKEKLDQKLVSRLSLPERPSDMDQWKNIISILKKPRKEVSIGVVGKYVELKDSYQSIHEALIHGGVAHQAKVNIRYIDSETITDQNVAGKLKGLGGILIPGGLWREGSEGQDLHRSLCERASYSLSWDLFWNANGHFGICKPCVLHPKCSEQRI